MRLKMMFKRCWNFGGLGFIPSSNREKPPVKQTTDPGNRDIPALDTLIPDNPNKPYDMKELIHRVVDEDEFFEIQPDYAANIIIGFGRLEGQPVGIVANQPMVLAGCLILRVHAKASFRSFL